MTEIQWKLKIKKQNNKLELIIKTKYIVFIYFILILYAWAHIVMVVSTLALQKAKCVQVQARTDGLSAGRLRALPESNWN